MFSNDLMTKDLQSDYKKKTHNATIRKKKKHLKKNKEKIKQALL